MSLATLTSQHQITIPAPVRQGLGLRPGDRLWFGRVGDKEVRVRKLVGVAATRGALAGFKAAGKQSEEGVWVERFTNKASK